MRAAVRATISCGRVKAVPKKRTISQYSAMSAAQLISVMTTAAMNVRGAARKVRPIRRSLSATVAASDERRGQRRARGVNPREAG